MTEKNNHPLLSSVIGLLALIVVIYRVIFIGYPIFLEGYQKGQISIILKSITTLV